MSNYSLSEPVHLLGWSLGGQIALEMAYQLEQKGYQEINIFLLDTVIQTPETLALHNQINTSQIVEYQTKHLLSEGFNQQYVDKIASVIPLERKILLSSLSGKLQHSTVTLFKAGKVFPKMDNSDGNLINILQAVLELPENGVSQAVDSEKITTVTLPNHHHNNILDAAGEISQIIDDTVRTIKNTTTEKISSVVENLLLEEVDE